MRRSRTLSWLLLFLVAVPSMAGADDAIAKRRAEARARFDRAIALADEGDLDRALAEFKQAYDLLPNARVLFNIAETQATLGRHADAVTTLDKLLAEPNLAPDEAAAARALRAREEPKVGELDVKTIPPGARVEIDNIAVATTPLEKPIRVSSGQRIVGAFLSGHAPVRQTVTVAGGVVASVSLELVPTESRLAHLALRTNLPGARLVANGQVVATTPIPTTLTFVPGRYHLELSRSGYTAAATDIDLGEGATGEVRLEPQIDDRALPAHGGNLELSPSETGAAITVDGRSLGTGTEVRLPAGPHVVVVEKAGFDRYERGVVVSEGKTVKLQAYLAPTPETRAAYVSSANRTKTMGWILLGAGGGTALVGTALAVLFSAQRSDAQTELDEIVRRAEARGPGTCDDVCLAEFDSADSKLEGAKLRQTLSFVGIGVGVAAAVAGVVFLGIADDPTRYDHPPKSATRARPVFAPLAGGAYWGLEGRF